ncbi:hypothetical protein HOY82DRAFT_588602 [Tuber indicum]|nr:hypothetical protein HOY82DRAFT_588602 [Tuber indicum]
MSSQLPEPYSVLVHSPATRQETDTVANISDCVLYSINLRAIFPVVVMSSEGKAHWVLFSIDSGSPLTYLSAQTNDLFGIREGVSTAIRIVGRDHVVYRVPQHSRFAEVDILGNDFFCTHRVGQYYGSCAQEDRGDQPDGKPALTPTPETQRGLCLISGLALFSSWPSPSLIAAQCSGTLVEIKLGDGGAIELLKPVTPSRKPQILNSIYPFRANCV